MTEKKFSCPTRRYLKNEETLPHSLHSSCFMPRGRDSMPEEEERWDQGLGALRTENSLSRILACRKGRIANTTNE